MGSKTPIIKRAFENHNQAISRYDIGQLKDNEFMHLWGSNIVKVKWSGTSKMNTQIKSITRKCRWHRNKAFGTHSQIFSRSDGQVEETETNPFISWNVTTNMIQFKLLWQPKEVQAKSEKNNIEIRSGMTNKFRRKCMNQKHQMNSNEHKNSHERIHRTNTVAHKHKQSVV